MHSEKAMGTLSRRVTRLILAILALVALVCLGLWALLPATLPPIAPPAPQSFSREAIQDGAELAKIGDCGGCHTAHDGAPYSGGRPFATPFGVIYASNITPDRDSGIGAWSFDAFRRAMRRGVSRDGAYLYPVFPYDHFRELTDADLERLYAFVMTRPAVTFTPPANRLTPPLGFRPLLAGWQFLFLRRAPAKNGDIGADRGRRGRYLVEALGHCGSCHTPRNWLSAEDRTRAYSGGWSEGWYAPPLNEASPAPRPWTADDLHAYLRTGLSLSHAAAAGPMGDVTRALASAKDDDVRAIATYVAGLMRQAEPKAANAATPDHSSAAAQAHPEAAALFAGACAACHGAGAPMMAEGRPSLALGTPLHEDQPRDTIKIILGGLRSPDGRYGPYMPSFASDFDDAQIGDLLTYLRARFTDDPPWAANPEQAVETARKEAAP
jgi:mono/diheme cytochrome c family protein